MPTSIVSRSPWTNHRHARCALGETPAQALRRHRRQALERTNFAAVYARLHDLRHTVGTYGGQAGLNAFMIRDLLGHKTLAMTARYVERDTSPMRAAADQVAGRIAAAMARKPR